MKGNWVHLLLEMMMKAAMLVTAALVRLLSLLSLLCPPVLSSFDFSVSEMNELRKYWVCRFSLLFVFYRMVFSPFLLCVLFLSLLLFWLQSCLCYCSVFLGWFFDSVLYFFGFHFLLLSSDFSAPFIETQLLASNQSCLYRTVIFPDKIVGERRGPRSDLLQIISSPAESGAPLLKRDGEDARLLATVPFRQKMRIFNLTPASGNLTIWSQQSFNFTLGLISIKSLNLFN